MSLQKFYDLSLDFSLIKKGLIFSSIGILLIILLYSSIQTIWGNNLSSLDPKESISVNSFELKPLAEFEDAFLKSSVFGALNHNVGEIQTSMSIVELTKDLRLKGVIFLDVPEAILEDARIQKSTFVRKGDKLGELEVKEIKEGAIVLTRGTDEKELRIQ